MTAPSCMWSSTEAFKNSTAYRSRNWQRAAGTRADESSASPTIGPDGDVYFGVCFTPRLSRILEHFSGDLSTTYTPGSFGWDDTVSIVPTSMVPSYTGPSTYLLMSKTTITPAPDGTGINKIALFDPKTTQIDPCHRHACHEPRC